MSGIGRRAFLTGASLAAAGAAAGVLQPGTATAAGRPPHRSGPPAVALARHDTPGDQDFPKVGGNLGNQNYTRTVPTSTAATSGKLGGAWYNRIEGGLNRQQPEHRRWSSTACIYIESALGNVIAVDGATGVTKWGYEQTRGTLTRRGVAVGRGKVFTHGRGNWVIALDQETGAGRLGDARSTATATSRRSPSPTTTACSTSAPTTANAARRCASTPTTATSSGTSGARPAGRVRQRHLGGRLLADRRRDAVDAPRHRPGARPGLLDLRQRPRQPVVAGRLRSAAG